jgi:putative ABC transport system permease protein
LVFVRDIFVESRKAIWAHRLRSFLTALGLTMGVATLIAVMTLIEGANLFVETKVANLGTNVFQIAKTPFASTDFNELLRSVKFRKIEMEHVEAVASHCRKCELVGATASTTGRVRYRDTELRDVNIHGQTSSMVAIDTRTVELGRYFTEPEDSRGAFICLIGDTLRRNFFPSTDPLNHAIHAANIDCVVVGVYEKIGSVLGQDQDNFLILPMNTFQRINGRRSSLTIHVKTAGEAALLEAQDEARLALRAARHVLPGAGDDFYMATKDSYIELWKSISTAFFAVFVMVSAVSALVGGIVIMNVMLVSVTERKKEIGIRRAVGATQADIRRQFLTESLMLCLVGGALGIGFGFLFAYAVRSVTAFPAHVETWVAVFGIAMSSGIGVFFGLYPAIRAARLDPVVALRAD